MWTSKSAPNMPVFNDFDFQIALARRRGANFVDILDRRSFATPVFRSYLCELSKRQNYGKTQHFAQFLPAKTSLLSNIDAARPTGNFQYSRKLELLNFLWQYIIRQWQWHYSRLLSIFEEVVDRRGSKGLSEPRRNASGSSRRSWWWAPASGCLGIAVACGLSIRCVATSAHLLLFCDFCS